MAFSRLMNFRERPPPDIQTCDQCRLVVWDELELQMHKMVTCPNSVVHCPLISCNAPVLKRELNAHFAISHNRCRFHSMGCGKEGSRDYIHNHERERGAIVHHWKLVAEYIDTLLIREEAVERELAGKTYQQVSDASDNREEKLRSIRRVLLNNREMAEEKVVNLLAQNAAPNPAELFDFHSNVLSLADRILIEESMP